MTDEAARVPATAVDDGLPLTRDTLSALRDGRLPREQARDVRARLSRDPAALALLGTLSSAAPAEEPVPRWAGTTVQRLAVVGVVVAVAVAALLWARHLAVAPPDPRAAPAVPEVTMAQLGTLWPAIEGRVDRDLLDDRERCSMAPGRAVAAQGAVVDGRYSMVVAYIAPSSSVPLDLDGRWPPDMIRLDVVPLDCSGSDYWPGVTVPR